MNKGILTLVFFIFICYLVYLIFSNFSFQEGMTNNQVSSVNNGLAGSAKNYAADIKSQFIKNQDILLISKYRNDYENAILNVDDLVNSMMLQTALSINKNDPMKDFDKLVKLNSVKTALNSVMKFVDASS
jgi:hypothetical protein